MKRRIFLSLFSISCFAISFFIAPWVMAVGISPPVINIPKLLKGTAQKATITVFNDGGIDDDIFLSVQPRGEYAHYIKTKNELVIPKGRQFVEYSFEINPQDAAVGDYKVLIDLINKEKPSGSSAASSNGGLGAAVSIFRGATVVVKFSVSGDQVVDYEAVSFNISDSEVGKPIFVDYVLKNKGNVEWKPDRVSIEIINAETEESYQNLDITNSYIPLAKPGQINRVKAQMAHNLKIGVYKAVARFYYEKKVVATLNSQKFNVFAPGTLQQVGDLAGISTNKTEYSLGEKVKLVANFQNTGEVPINAILVTEYYLGNELKDITKSPEASVDKGKNIEISQIFQFTDPGKYRLVSYVEYANKKTNSRDAYVNIAGGGMQVSSEMIILLGVIILIFVLSIAYKRHRDNSQY